MEFVNYFVGCSVHQSLVLQYGHTNKYSLPECSVITTFDHLMLNSLEQCLHLKECDAMRFANITTIATATIGISTANKYSINLLPPSNSYLSFSSLYHIFLFTSMLGEIAGVENCQPKSKKGHEKPGVDKERKL